MSNPRVFSASLIVAVSLSAAPALANGPNCPNPNAQSQTTIEERPDPQGLHNALRDRSVRRQLDALRAAEELRAIGDLPDPAALRAATDSAALDDAMGLFGPGDDGLDPTQDPFGNGDDDGAAPGGFQDPLSGVPNNRDKGPKGTPDLSPGMPGQGSLAGQQGGDGGVSMDVFYNSDGTRSTIITTRRSDGGVDTQTTVETQEGKFISETRSVQNPDGSSHMARRVDEDGNEHTHSADQNADGSTREETSDSSTDESTDDRTSGEGGGIAELQPAEGAATGVGLCIGGCRPIAGVRSGQPDLSNPETPDDQPSGNTGALADPDDLAVNPDPDKAHAASGGRVERFDPEAFKRRFVQ